MVSKPDLPALLTEWSSRLRILDWDVEIDYGDPKDLDDGTRGNCAMQRDINYARLTILSPEYDVQDNVEQTVIHELLHLRAQGVYDPADEDDKLPSHKRREIESFIEQLAWTLMRLKEEKEKAYLEGKRDQLEETIRELKKEKRRKK